ncbi:hypothetical protein ACTXT7_014716 [Hymenolepis weldensis]
MNPSLFENMDNSRLLISFKAKTFQFSESKSSLLNLEMSNETKPGVNIMAASFTYSIPDPENRYVWFRQYSLI